MTQRPATQRMDGTARRAQIRRVAAELFDASGYRETSMDDIAGAVGIKKASLYYYFPGKDQLLVELHEEMIDLIIAQQQERIDAGGHTNQQMLLAIMTDLIRLQETHPGHLKIFFEHFRELPPDVRASVRQKRDQYRDMLVTVLSDGTRDGSFGDIDVDLTAMAVLGMANWTYQWFRPGGRRGAAEVAEYFWSQILTGIAPA
ncbi:TetR family transcriptional regulator [Actinomycetospora succinea]|uniref:TetR family transcriptional regulator n=1 Tax=Actinomycetospora succinea TaxID=663603 RepID=A0A4R6VQS5_9PSEU|nr:TetR/AcrR family transcriptional regulator [Actinomycetospora succinea]TDQ64780.1 TetR family transcriptional regulator [Actinomycetospora succinea]